MGFSKVRYLALTPPSRAKKLADLLRVYILRLGKDWQKVPAEYDEMVVWHTGNDETPLRIGSNSQHARIIDMYSHWRAEAGLGEERDVYLEQDPGDRTEALTPPVAWSVLAHNLRSAFNVGSVLRICDCMGLAGAHRSGYTPKTDHPALRSAARGSEQWIPFQDWESPFDCIQNAKAQGIAVVALEITPDATPLATFQWPSKGLLVLGNEELGISPEILAQCDHKVYLPMYGRKASLNVASAFAITAHDLRAKMDIESPL